MRGCESARRGERRESLAHDSPNPASKSDSCEVTIVRKPQKQTVQLDLGKMGYRRTRFQGDWRNDPEIVVGLHSRP